MIIGEQKPLDEIKEMITDHQKILVLGCGTCVTVCFAGGEKEVGILASELRIARKSAGNDLEVVEYTCERQCDPEYIEPLDDLVKDTDAVVSIACSVGPQYVAARYPYVPVYPGLNTVFIGGAAEHGVWKEYCQACGTCGIGEFGGLCPIARCAKQLLNGPCGGSADGKCEVSEDIECIWDTIVKKKIEQGRLEDLRICRANKDWRTARDGGPRKSIREELVQ